MTVTVIDPVLGAGAATAIGSAVPTGKVRKFTHCTAYNGTGATVSIKVYLVPASGSPDNSNCLVDYDLLARETYTCPEVVGAAQKAGGTIQVLGLNVGFSAVASDTTA